MDTLVDIQTMPKLRRYGWTSQNSPIIDPKKSLSTLLLKTGKYSAKYEYGSYEFKQIIKFNDHYLTETHKNLSYFGFSTDDINHAILEIYATEDRESTDEETYTGLVSYLDFVEHPDTYTPEWEHYLKSPVDFFENPAKIDIREFKGRKLMTVPIDLGKTTVEDVKNMVVGVIECLSADHPMRKTLGKDDIRLLCCCVRSDDDYVINTIDEHLVIELRLRGGGLVRQTILSKKK